MKKLLIAIALSITCYISAQTSLKLDKKGKPLNGTITTEEVSTIYKNGQMIEKVIKDEYSDDPLIIEKFVNELPVSVEYFNFSIKNKPQKSYIGYYKDGRKYDGYFLGEVFIDNKHLIEFYENGELKFQYSFDYLKQDDLEEKFVYDTETSFKNGKIFNGYHYQITNGSKVVLRLEYKSAKPVSFDLDVFDMHYFNRISVSKTSDQLIVKELENKDIIKVIELNNQLFLEKYDGNNEVVGKTELGNMKNINNSVVIYYEKDNQLNSINISNDNLYSEYGRVINVFLNQIYSFEGTKVEELFMYLLSQYQSNVIDLTVNLEQGMPFKSEDVIVNLRYDSKGAPFMGVKVTKGISGFDYEVYNKGIKIKSGNAKTLETLKLYMSEVTKNITNQ